jgi:hypothetical protein
MSREEKEKFSKSKIYLTVETDYDDDKPIYLWNWHTSLEDAVAASPGAEIFVASPRKIGRFKMRTHPVRIKARKKVKK